MLVLYTEKQLKEAYKEYIKEFKHTPNLTIPTLEEFRVIYEDYWEMYYEQENRTDKEV
tara:strand:- start:796 stop:969 length:174 start_codon:yes stop_codon:yes gene_type:complete